MIAYIVIAAGLQFSPGTLVSSTNKSDSHDITQSQEVCLNRAAIKMF
jgi:hypothetical protein